MSNQHLMPLVNLVGRSSSETQSDTIVFSKSE